ncbi:MAG: hypothetical protein H6742_16330 [Alphaproteobacteria bacterium]|nr:hypothetical protein [Alphaproteobacteria bacterium]
MSLLLSVALAVFPATAASSVDELLPPRSPLVQGTVASAPRRSGLTSDCRDQWDDFSLVFGLAGGPWSGVEWYGEHQQLDLVLLHLAVPPPGGDPVAQARALGLETTDEDRLQVERFHQLPCAGQRGVQWMQRTDREGLFLLLDEGRVSGLAVMRKPERLDGGARVAVGTAAVRHEAAVWALTKEAGAEGGPAVLAMAAASMRVEELPGAEARIAELAAELAAELHADPVAVAAPAPAAGPTVAPVPAALAALDEALRGDDPVAWLAARQALARAVEAAPAAAPRDALVDVDARLVARLQARGQDDDAVGLWCAAAALRIVPSDGGAAALRDRVTRRYATWTPPVRAEGRLDDAVAAAWREQVALVRASAGLEGAGGARELTGVEPLSLVLADVTVDISRRTRTETARRGVDEGGWVDNSARVAEWQRKLDAYDAEIAEFERAHPVGAYEAAYGRYVQLKTFRQEHLERRPDDRTYIAEHREITWPMQCTTLSGRARGRLQLVGPDRGVAVQADVPERSGCQHDPVPALGLEAADTRPQERWLVEGDGPEALVAAAPGPAQSLLRAWWAERQLADATDPVERALRQAWLQGEGQPPLVLPEGPLVGTAVGPGAAAAPAMADAPPPAAGSWQDLLLQADAWCDAYDPGCPHLRKVCELQLLDGLPALADLCPARLAVPDDRYLPMAQPSALWAACMARDGQDDAALRCW